MRIGLVLVLLVSGVAAAQTDPDPWFAPETSPPFNASANAGKMRAKE